ncbi:MULTISPECIES: GMC family oxidoreductase N-terminal domain-containing protein [unclassified Pseudomonas]|uniref:GMC family oxidoreductase N-terminal domain-containing protein n=1 Tax=unclassified Pseudomonas TaxID=196821 RepID=UPI0008B82772|nr:MULTISPECIES: GMC family oxidoreductase N-terminal domain-containing protein [unclassified Pseudomonas]MCD4867110.1 GMC family oxidoreductase N-terminal domain-containing protein [Pseudomonas sp. PLB05]SEP46281.1 GMC oxidoreductase [Pseudomonas sp. Snoq117.2]
MSTPSYDHIVIGAVSASCVVTAQLIQEANASVLALKAGGRDSSPFQTMPATVVRVFQQKSWPYTTVLQPHCNHRETIIAQGKVLGAGSSVNGKLLISVVKGGDALVAADAQHALQIRSNSALLI